MAGGTLKEQIVAAWCDKTHTLPARGTFVTAPLRPGGATEALINLAVDLALAEADRRVEIAADEAWVAGYDAGRESGYDSGYSDGAAT